MGCPSFYNIQEHGSTGKVIDLRFESDKPGDLTSNNNIIAKVKFDKSGHEQEFWSYGGDVGVAFSTSCLAKTIVPMDISPDDKRHRKNYFLLEIGMDKKNTAFVEESGYTCTVYVDC